MDEQASGDADVERPVVADYHPGNAKRAAPPFYYRVDERAGSRLALASVLIGVLSVGVLAIPIIGWLISWVPGIVGIMLGVVARRRARTAREQGLRNVPPVRVRGVITTTAATGIVASALGTIGGFVAFQLFRVALEVAFPR